MKRTPRKRADKRKLYNYNDWLKGLVAFPYISIKSGVQLPKIVSWDDFAPEEALKVKKKQKEIFDVEVKKLLLKFKSSFKERYENVEDSDLFLSTQIKWCEDILFNEIENQEWITIGYNTVISRADLFEIKDYISKVKKYGMQFSLDSIHSPKSKHQDKSKNNPLIYAEAVWLFYKWLSSNNPEVQNTKGHINKLKAQDFALVYIIELYAKGGILPVNNREGGYDKKKLCLIGEQEYKCKGESFYKAVIRIDRKYDINKERHLERINKGWFHLLKTNSKNWKTVSAYLKTKHLYRG